MTSATWRSFERFSAARCVPLLVLVAVRAAADWPKFRSSTRDGHGGPNAAIPTRWSETNGIVWKTEILHRGWSTPVVAGGRVRVTTATADGRKFFALCLNSSSGRIVWQRRVFTCDAPEPLGNAMNSYASSSPVVASNRLYVHFGSYGTACLDARDGSVIWSRDDLPWRHYRGPGSSPVLIGGL